MKSRESGQVDADVMDVWGEPSFEICGSWQFYACSGLLAFYVSAKTF